MTKQIILFTILAMIIMPFMAITGTEFIGGLTLHLAVIAMTGAIAAAIAATFEKE